MNIGFFSLISVLAPKIPTHSSCCSFRLIQAVIHKKKVQFVLQKNPLQVYHQHLKMAEHCTYRGARPSGAVQSKGTVRSSVESKQQLTQN